MSTYEFTGLYDTKILINNSGTIQEIDLYEGNSVEFDPQTEEIEFAGDGQTHTLFFLTGMTAEITADALDQDAIASVFGKTAVTTVTGVAKRWYHGDNSESSGVTAGLAAYATVRDIDTGTAKNVKIVVPKGVLSPAAPPNVANRDKASPTYRLSAQKTTTDVAGTALTGVPIDGCFWYLDELS